MVEIYFRSEELNKGIIMRNNIIEKVDLDYGTELCVYDETTKYYLHEVDFVDNIKDNALIKELFYFKVVSSTYGYLFRYLNLLFADNFTGDVNKCIEAISRLVKVTKYDDLYRESSLENVLMYKYYKMIVLPLKYVILKHLNVPEELIRTFLDEFDNIDYNKTKNRYKIIWRDINEA